MELTENELKGIENLLIKDNIHQKGKNQKIIELKKKLKNKKFFSSLPKIPKNIINEKIKYKFRNKSLNYPIKITTPSINDNSKSLISNLSIKNYNKYKEQNIMESKNNSKKERSLIVKKILEQIKRKSNNNNEPKSSNTNLNLYGELYPGPGYYNINKNDIGLSHNLRYKNLFTDNSKKYSYLDKYEINLGPGSYNPTENFNYISYSQNPKVFISSLERPSFINENEINKNVGPGTYEIVSSFNKKNIKGIKSYSYSNKLENKKKKLKKWLQNELNINKNTNFFDINKKMVNIQNDNKFKIDKNKIHNKINEKNIGDDDIDFKNHYSIPNSKDLPKKYFLIKNKLKSKNFTINNIEYNKDLLFPNINKK